ncbi:restriction endonuclease [Actinoplanes regularis]|uniref:restriction endonuclease n=1 Tax=Actinoplanes regularis TaxID=52697 RepID=UPI0024A5548D|nr:restriction endonuclease [Actinoplanes regularis]GLW35634.1 hypothetical protein Areg01_85690 [Actinoplanes regularis]
MSIRETGRSADDPWLVHHVAGLMRSGGWQRVTIAARMNRASTDGLGVDAARRRWVVRCHHDAVSLSPLDVRRFAETVRHFRRGDVAVLVTMGLVAPQLWRVARSHDTRLVDRDALAWWASVQAGPGDGIRGAR